MRTLRPIGALLLLATAACDSTTGPRLPDTVELSYDFNAGINWAPAFTDYPVGEDDGFQLESRLAFLPAPLDTLRTAMLLSGVNHSDDLFMYVRRRVTDLAPNSEYRVGFTVRLASNAPRGCIGIGGAPGESVVLKAGAVAAEPVPVIVDGTYRLSAAKGEQLEEGRDALVLGTIATSSTACSGAPWELLTLDSGQRTLTARTDASGHLWLYVGIESGFEGLTRVYLTEIIVSLDRVRA